MLVSRSCLTKGAGRLVRLVDGANVLRVLCGTNAASQPHHVAYVRITPYLYTGKDDGYRQLSDMSDLDQESGLANFTRRDEMSVITSPHHGHSSLCTTAVTFAKTRTVLKRQIGYQAASGTCF